ncbi:unnamed protein product [Schistocephalus solidus]|uniref:Leucine-rich alpha-2-glycoprotein n=1 Tax=Schistocephalus solidus TaxID=70667 RepID=A0A183SU80_SCHSO|nr:unnamed protein product [Schistocephalus solidus]
MFTSHSDVCFPRIFGILFFTFLLLLSATLCEESQVSSTCKEHPVVNSSKVNTECWIDANFKLLHCSPEWYALHLEVINLQSKETSSENAASSEVSLNPEVFEYCPDLRVLAVWENSDLTRLQPEVLRPLVSLERLVIRSKKTRTLEKHLFAFVPRLQSLTISGSHQFSHLDRKVFEPCPQLLNSIDLSNNNLSGVLAPSLFRHCHLKNLYLQNNRLTGLDLDSLSGQMELRYLRLDGNQLSGSLEEALGTKDGSLSALAATPRLEVLDLSDNKLESINGCQWSRACAQTGGLKDLRRLSLSRNNLRWLDPEAFKGLSKLSELQLDGNPGLLTPDGFASLAVVLFSLSRIIYANLRHVNFPGDPAIASSTLDVCTSPVGGMTSLPVIIRRTTALLRNRICVHGDLTTGYSSTEAFPKTDAWMKPVNETLRLLSTEKDDEGDVVEFIRRAPRWMVACIGFGLLFLGILVALIVFGTLYFCLRPAEPRPLPALPTKGSIVPPNPAENYFFLGSRTSVDSPHIYSPEAAQLALPPVSRDQVYSPISSVGSPYSGRSGSFYMPLIRAPGAPVAPMRLYPRGSHMRAVSPTALSARQRLDLQEQRKRASPHLRNPMLSNSTYSLLPPRNLLSASMNVLNPPEPPKQAIV